MARQNNKSKILIDISIFLFATILAVSAAMIARQYLLIPTSIHGPSMLNTLIGREQGSPTGDTVYILTVGNIRRGDIVMIRNPNPDRDSDGNITGLEFLIKRVIAIGGDTLAITGDGFVYLNGYRLEEEYIKEAGRTFCRIDRINGSEFVIEEGYFFVMGDNRQNSSDSRDAQIGPIPRDAIRGRAVFRVRNGRWSLM